MSNRRHAQILGLGVFLVTYGTNVSTPLLVTYRERLDLGDSATMVIFTVYVAGIMIALPFGGQLSDRFGRKVVATPFAALSAVASVIMIFGQESFTLLLFGRFILGLVSGVVLSIGAAWMQELLGAGNEQKSAVLSTLLTYGGFGLGPPVSALIFELDLAPLTLPYLMHATVTLLVIPLMLRLPDSRERSNEPIRLKLGIPAEGQRLFRRRIAPAAMWVFCFPSTAFAFFPVVISDSVDGSPVVVAAASGALTALAGFVARPVLPQIGPNRALEVGLITGTIGYCLGATAIVTSFWWLVLPAAFLLGAASGLLTGGSLALLNKIADDATRGSINATFYLLAYPGMAMPNLLTAVGSLVGQTTALVAVTIASAMSATMLVSRRSEAHSTELERTRES